MKPERIIDLILTLKNVPSSDDVITLDWRKF